MPLKPIILLADMALAQAQNSDDRIAAYDIIAKALHALCPSRAQAARDAADALRAADAKQLQFREILRAGPPKPAGSKKDGNGNGGAK